MRKQRIKKDHEKMGNATKKGGQNTRKNVTKKEQKKVTTNQQKSDFKK